MERIRSKWARQKDLRPSDGSKKLKLGWWWLGATAFFAPVDSHPLELFVRNGQYTHLAVIGDHAFDACQVYARILLAGTVSDVHGELHLGEPVLKQFFAKLGIGSSGSLGIDGQIKHRQYPHRSISAQVHGSSGSQSGSVSVLLSPRRHRLNEAVRR